MQENVQNQQLSIIALPPSERAVIALESTKTEEQLRELVTYSAGITAVTDKDSREQAHRAGMNLKSARVTIEKNGKAAREDAQAFAKAVIAEEKRLVGIVQGEEDRVFALRDGYDAEQARIKAEAEAKEKARVAFIRTKIDGLKRLPAESFRDSAADIQSTVEDLEGYEITEVEFAEFAGEAADAKGAALAELRDLYRKAAAAEAEAARLAAERAELDRQRAEAEAARKAEEDRLRAEREALEAERRELEQLRAEKAAREAVMPDALGPRIEGDDLAVKDGALVSPPSLRFFENDGLDATCDAAPAAEEIDVPEFVEVSAANDDLAIAQRETAEHEDAANFRAACRALLTTHSTEQARIIFDEELQRFLAAA